MTRCHSGVAAVAVASLMAAAACSGHVEPGPRVIVLGVDGLDYALTQRLMAAGRMPHFAELARTGQFSPLATSIPPQSPVAWSTFIAGLDPGGTGIFDFIHRDPLTMEPYLSTTRTEAARRHIRIGPWHMPLRAGRIELLRQGEPFWAVLEEHDIESTILRMPANFPPSGKAAQELSGMGTPDILGTYGTFSFFTSRPAETRREVPGGIVVPVTAEQGVVRGDIEGPDNPYRVDSRKTRVPFAAYLAGDSQHLKLVVGPEERLLRVGEWSDWIPVRIGLMTTQSLSGQCRFYVKALDPYVELYVSPINLDPYEPALPISSPAGFAASIAQRTGRFYTQGMPADTKALRAGVLTPDEFLQQARLTRDETVQQYRDLLQRLRGRFLFQYFGHIDQISHMMWRAMDPQHPAYTSADAPYATVVADEYAALDALVGETLAQLSPRDLLVVMSDHGFTSWRRSFNLNGWLRDNGYLAVKDLTLADDPGLFANIDWSRTRAYGLGLNGLYINQRGREAVGIVPAAERESLAREIAAKLRALVDPATGASVITRVFSRADIDHATRAVPVAPDLIIGYAQGTRVSDESATGAVLPTVFGDNRDAWSGDHCMDPDSVPGILVTNRRLVRASGNLQTLGAALLAEFGLGQFPHGQQ